MHSGTDPTVHFFVHFFVCYIIILYLCLQKLESVIRDRPEGEDPLISARYMHDVVLPVMSDLRKSADQLETLTDKNYWPFPTYDRLLFSI